VRCLAVVALATALLVAFGAPAHAGGSAWRPDKTSYAPGEVAVARGDFGAGCCDRGWVDDGPYRVWLVPYGDNSLTDPVLPTTAIPVGELHVEQQRYAYSTMSQWVASTEFVVPDVPPGPYELVHCTDPCGNGLGDLMYAFFWVGPAPDFAPEEAPPTTPPATTPPATAPTTTDVAATPARTASTATSASSASSATVVAGLVAGLVALAIVIAATRIVVRRVRTR
jgi:hypothetical protein